MFTKSLTQAGHIRRFTIREAGGNGWEVQEEQDSTVIRRVCYTDWHRVVRALMTITLRVSELERSGWQTLATC